MNNIFCKRGENSKMRYCWRFYYEKEFILVPNLIYLVPQFFLVPKFIYSSTMSWILNTTEKIFVVRMKLNALIVGMKWYCYYVIPGNRAESRSLFFSGSPGGPRTPLHMKNFTPSDPRYLVGKEGVKIFHRERGSEAPRRPLKNSDRNSARLPQGEKILLMHFGD